MHKKIKIFFCDRGVVMMETLLSLPLYLILLAGMFWLGELCIARLAFTSGENLRLWEGGLRHPFTPVPERTLYSFLATLSSADDVVTGSGSFNFARTSPPQIGGWGIAITGSASMLTRRSNWSWGLNRGSLQALGYDETIESRSNEQMNSTMFRSLLNRNAFLGRRGIYNDGTDPDAGLGGATTWNNEYSCRWSLNSGAVVIVPPYVGTPATVRLYGARNGNYNQWSL